MTTVPTAGDEERLVERATYMVGNPSAWDNYDEAASTVIRDLLADGARLRQERDEARLNAAIIEGVSNELDIALTASNAEAERRAKEAERDKTDLAYAKQALNRETARALRFGKERDAAEARATALQQALRMARCPCPANHRPDEFDIGDCCDAGECGCFARTAFQGSAKQ